MVDSSEMLYNAPAMALEKTSLVDKARKGSFEAFEQLFRQHERRIYSLALHMLGEPTAAEDVLQDTFVRAWEKLGRLRHGDAFQAWLRRIALNLIWDRIRHRPPVEEIEVEAAERLPDGEAGAHETLAQQQVARRVQLAVMKLPEHQRIVVAMYYWEEMPVDEIARVLGIARGTVISRLARARETLRQSLGKAPEEEIEAT